MKRWVDETPDVPGARPVALTAEIAPRPLDVSRGWDEVVAGVAAAPTPGRLLFYGAAAALAAVLAVVVVGRWPRAQPGPSAPVVLSAAPGAQWHARPDGVVVVKAGRVSLDDANVGSARLETPHLRIDASHCRFAADVTEARTLLSVDEGEVVVRADGLFATVGAGERFVWPTPDPARVAVSAPAVGTVEGDSSPPPALIPSVVPAPAPAPSRRRTKVDVNRPAPSNDVDQARSVPHGVSPCSAEPEGERLECLQARAAGAGLGAQAALYEWGRLEAQSGRRDQALAVWRQAIERFPHGVLHPEIRLAVMAELLAAERTAEAVGAARAFEMACPDDPRRAQVAELRARLER